MIVVACENRSCYAAVAGRVHAMYCRDSIAYITTQEQDVASGGRRKKSQAESVMM